MPLVEHRGSNRKEVGDLLSHLRRPRKRNDAMDVERDDVASAGISAAVAGRNEDLHMDRGWDGFPSGRLFISLSIA